MNDKTKRIILITACCLLCGVAVIGIAGRFGGNTVTPSGVFAADPDYPNDRSHDILYCYQNAYDTADFIRIANSSTVRRILCGPRKTGFPSSPFVMQGALD